MLNYALITIGEKDYRCRLSAKACVELERKMGKNPLNIFMVMADGSVYPNLDDMMLIFHASLQKFHHSITLEQTYEIFDEYVDEGHTLIDLIPFILQIFQVSGFIPKEGEETPNAQREGNLPLGKKYSQILCLMPYSAALLMTNTGKCPLTNRNFILKHMRRRKKEKPRRQH